MTRTRSIGWKTIDPARGEALDVLADAWWRDLELAPPTSNATLAAAFHRFFPAWLDGGPYELGHDEDGLVELFAHATRHFGVRVTPADRLYDAVKYCTIPRSETSAEELVREVARRTGRPEPEARRLIDEVLAQVSTELATRGASFVPGLGTFTRRRVRADAFVAFRPGRPEREDGDDGEGEPLPQPSPVAEVIVALTTPLGHRVQFGEAGYFAQRGSPATAAQSIGKTGGLVVMPARRSLVFFTERRDWLLRPS